MSFVHQMGIAIVTVVQKTGITYWWSWKHLGILQA